MQTKFDVGQQVYIKGRIVAIKIGPSKNQISYTVDIPMFRTGYITAEESELVEVEVENGAEIRRDSKECEQTAERGDSDKRSE